jgi:hypothetical protein
MRLRVASWNFLQYSRQAIIKEFIRILVTHLSQWSVFAERHITRIQPRLSGIRTVKQLLSWAFLSSTDLRPFLGSCHGLTFSLASLEFEHLVGLGSYSSFSSSIVPHKYLTIKRSWRGI